MPNTAETASQQQNNNNNNDHNVVGAPPPISPDVLPRLARDIHTLCRSLNTYHNKALAREASWAAKQRKLMERTVAVQEQMLSTTSSLVMKNAGRQAAAEARLAEVEAEAERRREAILSRQQRAMEQAHEALLSRSVRAANHREHSLDRMYNVQGRGQRQYLAATNKLREKIHDKDALHESIISQLHGASMRSKDPDSTTTNSNGATLPVIRPHDLRPRPPDERKRCAQERVEREEDAERRRRLELSDMSAQQNRVQRERVLLSEEITRHFERTGSPPNWALSVGPPTSMRSTPSQRPHGGGRAPQVVTRPGTDVSNPRRHFAKWMYST
eukprot:PhM_4_TR11541/c0_g1_i1/m.10794